MVIILLVITVILCFFGLMFAVFVFKQINKNKHNIEANNEMIRNLYKEFDRERGIFHKKGN